MNDQAVVFQKGTCVNSKLKGTFDMRLKWIGELKEASIIQGAKVDRENNLSDILTHCQPSGKFTKAVLQIQQHHKKVLRTEKLSKYRGEPIGIHITELPGESPIQELIT